MKQSFHSSQKIEVKLTTLQLVQQAYAWAVRTDQSRRGFDRALNMLAPSSHFVHRAKPRIRILAPDLVEVELFSAQVHLHHPEAGG